MTLSFERPKDFDLRKFDDEGRFSFGAGKRVRLRFLIEKDAGLHVLETPLSLDQKVRKLPKHYEVTATVTDSAQLTWWLRSFGDAISDVRKQAAK